ncbi:hypothetical protein CRG49_005255 [Neisseria sp. N95_16]|nr:hypothetical protein [Neisseria sp. N177_16]PJO09885.1 hypothetical protein CRG49_005255 [Neisseria sp. N95_16]PJO79041.1 hypothetical protein CWC45_01825 [Neisseria sp. N177_16]
MTEKIPKLAKSLMTLFTALALWWLIKLMIKAWLYPLWNLPPDSDIGSVFAVTFSSIVAYRLVYGKQKSEDKSD